MALVNFFWLCLGASCVTSHVLCQFVQLFWQVYMSSIVAESRLVDEVTEAVPPQEEDEIDDGEEDRSSPAIRSIRIEP